MKKILSVFAASLISVAAMAQAQTDMTIGKLLSGVRNGTSTQMRSRAYGEVKVSDRINVIVTVDETSLKSIEEFAVVKAYAGGTAVVRVAVSDLERLKNVEGVSYIKAPARVKKHMKTARATAGVDKIHAGEGLPQAYDGTGTVVALFDTGFDPNHVAFTDKDGNTRIKTVSLFNSEGFERLSDPDEIASLTTDNAGESHGTHTSSMAAGREVGNGFGGVASNADIIIVTIPMGQADEDEDEIGFTAKDVDDDFDIDPDFDDEDEQWGDDEDEEIGEDSAQIMMGAKEAVELMKLSGKPAVLNLSVGINQGPRDETTPEARFFQELSQDAIICMSAGNEANNAYPMAWRHTFTEDGEFIYTALYDMIFLADSHSVEVNFWSSDNRDFEVELVIFNGDDYKYAGSLANIVEDTAGEICFIGEDDEEAAALLASFGGRGAQIAYRSLLNQTNNRYNVGIGFNGVRFYNQRKDECTYYTFKITAHAGQTVYGYVDDNMDDSSKCFTSVTTDMGPSKSGTNDGCINTLAIGSDVIMVGAYSDRGHEGGEGGNFGEEGIDTACSFSSWANLNDGTSLPHIMAPGYAIIAAYNLYCEEVDEEELEMDATIDFGGRENLYGPMTGTSMSSPYTAGVVALWLQANPDLTAGEILEIMQQTAVVTEGLSKAADPAVYGAGLLNAYEGLKRIISTTSVGQISAENVTPLVKVVGNTLEITVPQCEKCQANLFNMMGQRVASSKGNIDLSGLSAGVYVLNVNGKYTQKVVVK